MTYQPMVREILSEQDTPANEELVLAMIYTETKGKEGDVMQSSNSFKHYLLWISSIFLIKIE
ncbi:pneumococcal vaccine antigen A [Streptococcus pneumoniae]|nr:pneumococcal vaccine antigen A [Streptococcus pneumoniae]